MAQNLHHILFFLCSFFRRKNQRIESLQRQFLSWKIGIKPLTFFRFMHCPECSGRNSAQNAAIAAEDFQYFFIPAPCTMNPAPHTLLLKTFILQLASAQKIFACTGHPDPVWAGEGPPSLWLLVC